MIKSCANCENGIFPMPVSCKACGFKDDNSNSFVSPVNWKPNLKVRHEKLYKRLPDMKCVPGCTDCCGPVPFSKWEADQAGVIIDGIQKEINCKFSCKEGCSIYEKRPFMCRLFGVVEGNLQCTHKVKPEYMITKELAQELTYEYITLTTLQKD
jgi:uncharacterized protein